ncbi:MAG: dehydratase [Proteobacteria bacterium]|nr:dehydratase [Pseudomonadota bacterium]
MNELHGFYLEDLAPGMTASTAKTITDNDITLFTTVSGDDNPVHCNSEYAATTQFKGRIAQGLLTTSVMSSVLSNKLPGHGSILLEVSVRFKAPVYPGDTVKTTVTVREVMTEKRRVIFDTASFVENTKVLEGQATLLVDSKLPS